MRNASSVAALFLSATLLAACGSQPQAPAKPPTPKATDEGVLAVVGERVIRVEDFESQMNEQPPFVRSRYKSPEKKKEFLDNMIRNELMALEAERRGYDKDPEIQRVMQRMIVQKLFQEIHKEGLEEEISDEEIAAFYEQHINDYVKPERLRLSHIFFNVPKSDPQRAKVRAEAAKLAAEIRAKEAGPNKNAFAEAAKERSDDQISKRAGGDLSFRTEQELSDLFGAEMAKAAFALQAHGEISQVVETERGLHIIKLTGRQAALNRTLEQARDSIRSRLSREKSNQRVEAMLASLREKTPVEINEAALEAVEIDAGPAQARGTGLGPSGLGNTAAPGGRAAGQGAPSQAEKQ